MNLATVLSIISLVNGLISIAKEFPAAKARAALLLSDVQPYIQEAGVEAATAFESAKEALTAL